MAEYGVMTAAQLDASEILQKKLASDIIQKSVGLSVLNNPNVVRTMGDGSDIDYYIPTMDSVAIHEDIPEGVKVSISTASYETVEVKLLKDIAFLAITDETKIRTDSNGIPLWNAQMDAAARKLAAGQDKKIVTALNTTPQAGTAINLRTTSIYGALSQAQSLIGDYNITSLVCSRAAKIEIMANVNKVAFSGADPKSAMIPDTIPGTDIPIITSSAVDLVDSDSLYFVSSEVPGCAWIPGPVKREMWRDYESGKDMFKLTAFRAAKSNIEQTSSSTNQGVVETAWAIA